MTTFKTMSLFLALTLGTVCAQAELQSGTITGKSNLLKSSIRDPNVMALTIQNDAASKRTFAILSEYDRKAYTHFLTLPIVSWKLGTKGAYLTSWINRMHIYEVSQKDDMTYTLIPLEVTAAGDIQANNGSMNHAVIRLEEAGSLKNATIDRYDSIAAEPVETIKLNNKRSANSTWEDLVPGNFFLTDDNTGGDYSKKDVNGTLSDDGTLLMMSEKVSGQYQLTEKLPKMFVVTSAKANNVGAEHMVGRIAVFVDIVNWKGLGIDRFTTEEMLFINPNNPSDVGFYYERH